MAAALRAVIDADILYSRYPRNLLVWAAVERAFALIASEHIFDEVREHLIQRNVDKFGRGMNSKVERSIDVIRIELDKGAGDVVDRVTVEDLIPELTAHDPDDRHVFAAAVAGEASIIVTHNLDDFDREACRAVGVEVMSLDDFLMELYMRTEVDALASILDQFARFPPHSLEAVLDIVTDFAPNFAAAMRSLILP